MARETWVQSQVESYQRLKKWYLMPPCLTHSIIRYGSRVKWSNPGKGVAPSPTPWCSKLSKREPSGHPRLWSPTLLTYNAILFHSVLKIKSVKWDLLLSTHCWRRSRKLSITRQVISCFLTNCIFKLFNRLRTITVYLWLCKWNARCVAVTDLFVLINGSTMKVRCSPVQFMASTEKETKIMALYRNKTKRHYMKKKKMALYVLLKIKKNTFLFLYFICLLLNLQMCQIILPDPVLHFWSLTEIL